MSDKLNLLWLSRIVLGVSFILFGSLSLLILGYGILLWLPVR